MTRFQGRAPREVHVTTPSTISAKPLTRTITVTPEDMALAVKDVPVYEPDGDHDRQVREWMAWSARCKLALALGEVADKKARATSESKSSSTQATL